MTWRTARALLAVSVLCASPAAAAEGDEESCVDVRIGTDRAYSCLNRSLALSIPPHRPSSLDTPLRADGTPSPANGVFDRAATAETLGNAFGHSVHAQRPPPAVYLNPVIPHFGR